MIKKEIKIRNLWKETEKRTLNLEIYEGYEKEQELHNYMEQSEFRKDHYVTIKLLGMYYAVIFESYDKEAMIGRERVWYRQDSYMNDCDKEAFRLPYKITSIKQAIIRDTVFEDLLTIDSDIEIYMFKGGKWANVTAYKYARTYVVLLGLTFYVDMFDRSNYYNILSNYFDAGYYGKLFKYGIIEFNPFQSKVKHEFGKIQKYRFY